MSRFALPFTVALLALGASCVPEVAQTTGCVTDDDCAAGERCVEGACDSNVTVLPTAPDAGVDTRVSCTVATEGERCGPGSFCATDDFCAPLPACGAGCPDGLECNDGTGTCVRTPDCEDCCTPGSCSDGRWCNGLEQCDPETQRCTEGVAPCGAQTCDEVSRSCLCGGDGDCTAPETCNDNGVCECVPACTGRQCGGDGCGGSCGTCAGDDVCNEASGRCVCTPQCDGLECGSDGCDGTCGTCPGANDTCTDGLCECVPDCTEKVCGDDGCGGSCGTCTTGTCSANGKCDCVPQCTGKDCGDDGCGGSCGTCATGSCDASGQCGCTPDCSTSECGSDGCGGSCGTCGPHQICLSSGQCVNDGVVCDVLTDTITMDEYQSRTGYLTAGFDEEYEWDSRPYRILDNYPYTGPAGATVDVELTSSDFDPVLYVYETSGACIRVAKDDDSGPGLGSALSITLQAGGDYHFVTTSFGELDDGQYSLSTKTTLCGLEAAPDIYDACEPRVTAGGCNNNWCIDYGNSPQFCCLTSNCISGYGAPAGTATLQSSTQVCNP